MNRPPNYERQVSSRKDNIINALEKVQTLAEAKIKRLHMDNAKKQATPDVTKHPLEKCKPF